MSKKAGQLLWNRKQISIPGQTPAFDVDTGVTQVNRAFTANSVNEPGFDTVGALGSRIQVIPMSPIPAWATITHGEPFLDPATDTVHVVFANSGSTADINVLFWDPHTSIGPGDAAPYI